uniref:E3 ubiquitin-protein ligase Midline-1-like n=1 Tax=Erpetoichthys calabaricus TaxID=27687 RepID=A0A8C4XC64_ERPCA
MSSRFGATMETLGIDEELICAVCRDVFVEPVTLPCGHNYCEECVSQLKKSATAGLGNRSRQAHYTCPLCLAPCAAGLRLNRNVALRNIIEKYRHKTAEGVSCSVCKGQQKAEAEKSCVTCGESYCTLHIMPHLENDFFRQHVLVNPTENTERLCKKHGKELELYCKSDSTALCVFCMIPAESGHLEGHDVVRITEVLNTMREECQVNLRKIRENLLHIQTSHMKLDQTASNSKNSIEQQRQSFLHFLQKVKLFIDIEEAAWEKKFSVDVQLESSLHRQSEEKLQQMQKSLEDAECAFNNAVANQDPLTLVQVLKNTSWDHILDSDFCSSKIHEVMQSMSAFQKGLRGKIPVLRPLHNVFQVEEILLDPKTAHAQLKISRSHSAVCAMKEIIIKDQNSERFKQSFNVLGIASFSSGRHYWEVTVRGLPTWALGLALNSISREPPGCKLGSNEKSWSLSYSRSRNQFCAQHNLLVFSFMVNRTPEKIGLFLDVESGILAFYDANVIECLYTFYCSFKEPVYPAFCPRFHIDVEYVADKMQIQNGTIK